MSTASREKCCSIGVQIIELQYTDAVYTSKSYWCITSPTIELYNEIIELKKSIHSQNIISKIKGDKMVKNKEHF